MAPRHCSSSSGVSWIPIQPDRPYVGDAVRRALRVLEPAEEDRRVRLLYRLRSEAACLEVGELAVVLEQIVRPDALHDLDRLAHVLVALGEDVRGARRGELLGHPARPHAHVDPAVREVVDGGDLRGQDAGRAVWRVGDAHADANLGRLRGEPGDERPTLEPLTAGRHRQCLRELVHHAERVLELRTIGGLGDDDPVERPDGVEVELLGEAGEILELLDGHLVAEVRQVQRELHETASSPLRSWMATVNAAGKRHASEPPSSCRRGSMVTARRMAVRRRRTPTRRRRRRAIRCCRGRRRGRCLVG